MKDQTFAFEVKDMILQFMDALDDIVIRRYNNQRQILSKFRVTMLYSPKQRVLNDLINKEKTLVLPVISVSLGGIQRDPERVFNKLDGSYYNMDGSRTNVEEHLRQPLPVDITVNVSILSEYQADLDQILTNFIPYFDPYIVIEWHIPDFGFVIRSPVFWSGTINTTYPTDTTANENWRVSADTSFTIKGWIFKSLKKGSPLIYKINSTYTAVKDLALKYSDLEQLSINGLYTDYFTISARPQPQLLLPPTTPVSATNEFVLYGDMFSKTTGVYLSGTNIFSGLSSFDFYSGNKALSANYPAFSAVPVQSFSVESENKIMFTIPSPQQTGWFDIIVTNMAGYGNLAIHTNHFNLIPTTTQQLSGIQVT